MENIQEKSISPYTDFQAWIKKRIDANRSHFLKNIDLENWPAGKYIEYKNFLYLPLSINWPVGQDHGILNVKLVGHVRKLQSGPSTDIIPLNNQQIKIQVSRDIDRSRKKKTKIKKFNSKPHISSI